MADYRIGDQRPLQLNLTNPNTGAAEPVTAGKTIVFAYRDPDGTVGTMATSDVDRTQGQFQVDSFAPTKAGSWHFAIRNTTDNWESTAVRVTVEVALT